MVEGEASAEHRLLAAEDLPGGADARFECCPIHLDARRRTHTILIGNEKLSSCGNIVGQASASFGDRSGHIPGHAKIEGESWCYPPIILDEGTVDFPSPAGDGPVERLIMNGQASDAEQKIGLRIAADVRAAQAGKVTAVADDPEAILESLGANVHLIAAYVDPHLEVVLVTSKIERVFEREDICSALEWRIAAIADGPIATCNDGGNQSAAVCARKAGAARASQVGVGNAAGNEVGRGAGSIALRSDVVEDAVVTEGGLVHHCG